jgi:hypothetical protein
VQELLDCKNPDYGVLAEVLAVSAWKQAEVLALLRTKKKAQVVDLLGPFGCPRTCVDLEMVPASLELWPESRMDTGFIDFVADELP